MIDPARTEVKDAVQTAHRWHSPVMITGDHPLTAGYIAVNWALRPPMERIV